MAVRLNYLIWYSGNLSQGFDYIYTKFNEAHAFWIHREPGEEVANISDPDFDFFNPHFNERGETFNWSYDEQFVDLSKVWDHFSDVTMGFTEKWHKDYRGPAADGSIDNVEWGVRWSFPNEPEQLIWGINAYPERYEDFVNYLKSFDPINPTPVPGNLPFSLTRNRSDI